MIWMSCGDKVLMLLLSLSLEEGWVGQEKTCSINFPPSPDKDMEKVGMCVKVLLSQTKIIKPFTYVESDIEYDSPKRLK